MSTMDVASLSATLADCVREFDQSPSLLWLEAVDGLYSKHPHNSDQVIVEGKIQILDLLYSTQLRYSNLKNRGPNGAASFRLAQWLVENQREFKQYIDAGDPSAVEMLETRNPLRNSDGSQRFLYSFASKFAHFHNQLAFPIYDSRADNSVRKIAALRPFRRSLRDLGGDDWYRAWVDCLNEVRSLMGGVSFRDADKALYWWNGGKPDEAEPPAQSASV
jgi:hypothetical protein